MNAHQPVALLIPAINPIDRVNDLLNGAASKLIAKYVERDFSARSIESRNGLGDALNRARVAKNVPIPQPINNGLPPSWGVRDPLACVLGEHVLAHIIHHLDAFQIGIDL